MSSGARDLLLVLLGLAGCVFAWRGRAPPPLGAAIEVARCEVPVERAGQGVECLSRWRARAAGLRAGDRAGDPRPGGVRGRMAPERLAALGIAVDVNHASAAELTSLDGIGPKLAARIVAARPFAAIDAVGRVRGVGSRRLSRLRPRLRLGP